MPKQHRIRSVDPQEAVRRLRARWLLRGCLFLLPLWSWAGTSDDFLAALKARQVEKASAMLKSDPALAFVRTAEREPAVVVALRCTGDGRLVQQMLEAGASADSRNTNGDTLLSIACCGTNDTLVRFLLARKASVTLTNAAGKAPLEWAVDMPPGALDGTDFAARLVELVPQREAFKAPDLQNRPSTPDAVERDRLKRAGELMADLRDRAASCRTNAALWAARTRMVDALLAAGAGGTNVTEATVLTAVAAAPTEVVARLLEQKPRPAGRVLALTPLDQAVLMGRADVVRLLLEHGIPYERPHPESGCTPLMIAARDGHLDIVRLLVEAGADVNASDVLGRRAEGTTPLLLALGHGRLDVARYLVERGASATYVSPAGQNALNLAAINRDVNLMKELLRRGASPLVVDKMGFTPLLSACESGCLDGVKLLLEHGATLGGCDNRRITALMFACASGSNDLVRFLLEKGQDPNARGGQNNLMTPLLQACAGGFVDVVRTLFDAGARLEEDRRDYRLMPLHCAAVMLNRGAKHYPGGAGMTDYYADPGSYARLVRLLLEKGADPRAESDDGGTVLQVAALGGNVEIVRLLLDLGLPVDESGRYGKTPLFSAATRGHVEVLKLLLDRGAKIDAVAPADNRETALHNAAIYGHAGVVTELLRRGALPDVRDASGATPLLLACSTASSMLRTEPGLAAADSTPWVIQGASNRLAVVRALLDGGADPRATANGFDALATAVISGDPAMVALLLDRGLRPDGHYDLHEPGREVDFWRKASLLHVAAFRKNVPVLRLLLAHGAPADMKNGYGETALFLCAANGSVECLDVLAAAGAPVNAANRYRHTPLLEAIQKKRRACVERLIQLGADVTWKAENGWDAMQAARDCGDPEILRMVERQLRK